MTGVAEQASGMAYGERHAMLIDGERVRPASGADRAIINPANGDVIATVSEATRDDVDAAVAAARQAFAKRSWRGLSADARASILWRVNELITQHAEELALMETRNLGVPLMFARYMVASCAEAFRYYAGWCTKIHGRTSDVIVSGGAGLGFTRREPLGVAGLIAPWNAPLMMASWKLAPALAAGCACVLKPSEETPLTALRLGELLLQAGVPAGVVNIVTGVGAVVGSAIVEHPDVNKVSFTGSTGVGRAIVAAAAGNFKRVTLELGGKSPFVIHADADLAAAIPSAAQTIFGNSGQVCVAGSRLFVHRTVYDQVVEGLSGAARGLTVGDPMDPATMMGPLISERQLDRVGAMIASGRSEGATVAAGGKRIGERGFFVQPTVFTDVRADMRIVREEIFGPVICAIPFDDPEEVIREANDTTYGLSSYVWTRDIKTALHFAENIEAGSVKVNCSHDIDYSMPLGGYKASGWGREHGPDGVDAYLETKSVTIAQ